MAIRTACPRCGKRFSAPEDYHGKKIDCPRCHHRCVIRTVEEEAQIRADEDATARKREEDRQKLELLERLERSDHAGASGVPYFERFQTGLQGVRHYYPGQPSRFRRLRALSDVLLFAAYLQIAIALVLVGILIALKSSGSFESTVLFAVSLCGTIAAGLFAFFTLKFFGELAFLLSDIGDQQTDLVHLLLDVRSNTDSDEDAS